jgi:ABC-type cobalamin/Fe3+-siderophores transport system ATPase subunit
MSQVAQSGAVKSRAGTSRARVATSHVVELRDVVMRFGDKRVLDDVSLAVDRQERLVIIGQSGAGKTTILRLILGILKPNTGSVSFKQHEVSRMNDPIRMKISKPMGADAVLDPKECDVVGEVKKLTSGGADVAIEALGLQETFENSLRCLRAGGTLSSLGVYSGKLQFPYDAFAAGIGDYKIVTTLCPGGKERMRRLMSMVQSKRFDPTPLLTHKFSLDQIVEAYDLFGSRRDGVLKVAIRP